MSTVAPAWPDTRGNEKAAPGLDTQKIRRDFPILSRKVHGKPLVYLDNAATTQKPLAVIEAERDIYERYYANIHRGVHLLSVESTEAYEKVREKVRDFLHAAEAARSFSSAARPKRSTSWPRRWDASGSDQGMRSWSPLWSTIPTSFPGRCCVRRRAPDCASFR